MRITIAILALAVASPAQIISPAGQFFPPLPPAPTWLHSTPIPALHLADAEVFAGPIPIIIPPETMLPGGAFPDPRGFDSTSLYVFVNGAILCRIDLGGAQAWIDQDGLLVTWPYPTLTAMPLCGFQPAIVQVAVLHQAGSTSFVWITQPVLSIIP
jgi:hypothetical protein